MEKIISFVILFMFAASTLSAQSVFSNQEEPGITPKLFLPELFNSDNYMLHGFPAFDPHAEEVYWSVIPPRVLCSKREEGKWQTPEKVSFSDGIIQAPYFSSDGNRIYFQLNSAQGFGSLDIWYIEKEKGEWGNKINLGSPPNSDKMESQPVVSENGNLYFTGYYEKSLWNRGIYRSRFMEGKFEEPVLLPEIINSPYIDYTPFISDDESFLLFASSRPGNEEKDLRIFVSFRSEENNWSEPVNLNDIMEFDQTSRFPSLTPDGKYIIFLSGGSFYWVSSDILNKING